jgi:predicted molibdopterin-dependent oxidoreductase YjgC
VADRVRISVDGRPVEVDAGLSVLAALWNAGGTALRRSVSGEERGPLCGMGVCHECRVTIDGVAHRRSCLEAVREGMEVRTGG